MPIGIRDEHEHLRDSLRRWTQTRCPSAVTRAALDADADGLPPFWSDLGAQGSLGIALPEQLGGQGAGMVELAIVAEELGRAAAPGPWASTAVVGAIAAECGSPTQLKELVPGLADGSSPASVVVPVGGPDGSAVARPGLVGTEGHNGGLTVRGTIGPVLSGSVATTLLAPVEVEGRVRWVLLEPRPDRRGRSTPQL